MSSSSLMVDLIHSRSVSPHLIFTISMQNAILPEYKGTENVYRNVVTAFSGLKFKYKLKSWGKIGNRIAGFLEMFQ